MARRKKTLFRSRFRSRERTDRGAEESLSGDVGERALETLAEVLTILGRHAFDLGDSPASERRTRFEGWSRHLTLRTPPPGEQRVEAGEITRRSWAGIRHFVTQQRQQEKEYVARSTGNLRTALWAAVQGLGGTVLDVQATDDKLRDELRQFMGTVRDSPPEEVMRETRGLVDRLQDIVAQRQGRQKTRMRKLSEQMRSMRAELTEARRSMESDPLTRLFNRGAFDSQLERISALNTITGDVSCLGMIDIDHFKVVNDTHGHPAGDEVLRQLGRCLATTFPRKTDFIARYGGEEFAIIFERDSLADILPLAEKLLENVREMTVEVDDAVIGVTVSVGLAEQHPGEDGASWLERADRALYRAKDAGRDQVAESDGES